MTPPTLMKCGHVPQGHTPNGSPVCVICFHNPGDPSTQVADQAPELSGRLAKCPSCRRTVASELTLAFFQWRGPGSPYAKETCKNCGYHEVAHTPEKVRGNTSICPKFEPLVEGHPFDSFYCGCKGWD